MISELVAVVASCVMLTTAQFQMPIHQLATLPNIQPIQITSLPNSQLLMTQSAHSILNQDTGTPLSPGLFGGLPVLVSEAAQSILDQESKIVGYSYPNNLQAILQQQHQQFQPINNIQSSPQLFSNNRNEARPSQQLQPQSLSIPLINNDRNRPENVVPVRAVVSLNSLLAPKRPSDNVSNKQNVGENFQKAIYYDIPPNHPVPPPPSYSNQEQAPYSDAQRHPGRQNQEFLYNQNRENPQQSYQDDRQPQPSSSENGNRDHLRRPPPSRNFFGRDSKSENDPRPENHWRPSPDNREPDESRLLHKSPSSSQEPSNAKSNEESSDKVEKRKKPKNRHSKPGSTKEKSIFTLESRTKVDSKRHNADSATDASESSFLTSLLSQYQPANPPQALPSYENNNNFQQSEQGYSSSDDERPSLVHKHIFVHAAPQESYPERPRVRVIRPPVKPEQHVQIIFVKSPNPPPPAQTVVELPTQQQPKTLVYILSKKPEDNSGNVRVVSPPASKPHSPEIYFIRYGDRRENQGYPVPDLQSLHLEENFPTTKTDQGNANAPVPLNINQFPFLRQKRNKDYGLDVYAPLMAYSTSGQINEITKEEADSRHSNLDAFF